MNILIFELKNLKAWKKSSVEESINAKGFLVQRAFLI